MQRETRTNTVCGMREGANLEALRMIAAEHSMRDKKLLDSIAQTRRLTTSRETSETGMLATLSSISDRLPEDMKFRSEDTYFENGKLTSGDSERGVAVSIEAMEETTGEQWVTAAVSMTAPIERSDDGLADALVRDTLRELNNASYGCVWVEKKIAEDDEKTYAILRVSGAAARTDSDMRNWRNIVASLYQEAVMAREDMEGERGPAWWSLQLKSIENSTPVTSEDIKEAALNFRGRLDPRLRDVVSVASGERGASISVPFRATGETFLLRVTFMCDKWGEKEDGVRVLALLYKPVPREETEKWIASFNEPGREGEGWLVTTAWNFGSWSATEMPGNRDVLFYKGFIPSYMTSEIGLEEIIEGTLREVWATSDKYRLHEEFRETIGDNSGAF